MNREDFEYQMRLLEKNKELLDFIRQICHELIDHFMRELDRIVEEIIKGVKQNEQGKRK